jgi:hypothetical protein
MAVYEFGTTIAFRREDGSTEQFGRSDYRFELIRRESDPQRKMEIANHQHISEIDKTLKYVDGKIFSDLGFEIPLELLGYCSLNLGHSKYIKAYVSKYITDIKGGNKPEYTLSKLKKEVPYLDDGSLMLPQGVLFDELKDMFWKDMTPGVEKKLKSIIRQRGCRCVPLFAVGIFYSDLNPNNQIKILEQWANSVEMAYEDLTSLKKIKEDIWQLYTRTEFIQKCARDHMWVEHIQEIIKVLAKIRSYTPSYTCPTSYDLNETLSILNSTEKRLGGKLPTPFKTFWNKWSFFDGISRSQYSLKLMKDDFEMSDYGSLMKICIGNSNHVSDMASGDYFMAIIYKDGSAYACIKYNIRKSPPSLSQFLKKGNQWFNPDQNAKENIDEEYQFLIEWLDDIVSGDPFRIRSHVTQEFAIDRLRSLQMEMDPKEFRQLAISYGVNVNKLLGDDSVQQTMSYSDPLGLLS